MNNAEVEPSEHVLLLNLDSSSHVQPSMSIDLLLDEFLRNARTCTHTHTCNPPGPDAAHTHTCYHTHTQVLQSEEDYLPHHNENPASKPRKASRNREAVKKYREKRKARQVYLEEEVKKLQLVNQHLVRKLQGQVILEAEVLRLRGLLMAIRGKIDGELGTFPFQKQCNVTSIIMEGDCGVQSTGGSIGLRCENEITWFHLSNSMQPSNVGGSDKMVGSLEGHCQPRTIDCGSNTSGLPIAGHGLDAVETLVSSSSQV